MRLKFNDNLPALVTIRTACVAFHRNSASLCDVGYSAFFNPPSRPTSPHRSSLLTMTMTDAAIQSGACLCPARQRRGELPDGRDPRAMTVDGRRVTAGEQHYGDPTTAVVRESQIVRRSHDSRPSVPQRSDLRRSWLLNFAAHASRCPAAINENLRLHERFGRGLYSSSCLYPDSRMTDDPPCRSVLPVYHQSIHRRSTEAFLWCQPLSRSSLMPARLIHHAPSGRPFVHVGRSETARSTFRADNE